jgi:phospholipid/cholesterol/gamma-HCH transport system permease protein
MPNTVSLAPPTRHPWWQRLGLWGYACYGYLSHLFHHRLTPVIAAIGHNMLALWAMGGLLLKGRLRLAETLKQGVSVGNRSMGMVLLLNAIAGAVLSLQTAHLFRQTGAQDYVGGLVTLAIVREMAPLFTAMAVGARAGTAMAAELGNMAVTKQLDALTVLQINPIRFLWLPRTAASVVMLIPLTLLGEAVGVGAGMMVAEVSAGISRFLFLESAWLTLVPRDIWISCLKAAVFGGIIALVSCYLGVTTRGGARQVGVSAMKAAVWVAVVVVIADLALTWFFYT